MLLYFPSLDTLRLALTSGILPEAVCSSSARFAFEDKSLWVEPSVQLNEKVESRLLRLGVQLSSDSTIGLAPEVTNWLEIFPLERDAVEVGDKTPVLFELTGDGQLAELAIEILRLGNDRQSFRWLSSSPLPLGEGPGVRGLLCVIGPPYYSLLRALDCDGGALAYREMAPRVWVQVGYTHPLAEHLKPPNGQMLLIREPRQWSYIPEAAWSDIYEVIAFQLPDTISLWHDVATPARMRVPVKLTHVSSAEAGELWLLRDDGIAQLEELVRSSDNELLARLAFAVGEKDGERIVVLRVRPSKNPPPVLVLNGLAFRTYLRIPNLFLPVGTILHPPLRRDAVIKLLAEDRTRLVWLTPSGSAFTPESVPDNAFRPLHGWVDYVLENEHQAITIWLGATQFQFESFICKDDALLEAKPPKVSNPPKKPEPRELDVPPENLDVVEKKHPVQETPTSEVSSVKPTELEQRLRELEDQYNTLQTPLEDPARQALWRAMAQLNGALNQPSDAAIGWSNALWEEDRVNPDWPREWLQADSKQPVGAAQISRIVSNDTPSHGNLRLVAAYLIWAATVPTPPADLGMIQQFLLKHESYLGVRTLWLAWHALHQLAGSDVLTLARARDRLLERLHLHGLTPELDLPGFLRFTGMQASNRFRVVRDQVVRLRGLVQEWAKLGSMPVPETHAYIDLVFAFGLARLGETNEARKLLREAGQTLAHADEVHSWLYQAFEFRVQQALDGKTSLERLPTSLLQRLEAIEKPDYLKLGDPGEEVKRGLRHLRLIIERMQSKSRILEPLERLDAYRRTFSIRHDELHRELIGLADLHDREELIQRFSQLFNGKRKFKGSTRTDPRILIAALDLAPRLGQAFGEETLDRVPAQLARLQDAEQMAELLEKALLLAAHCDRKEDVQRYVAQLQAYLLKPRALPYDKLIPLVTGSLRGLCKFGLRDTVAQLLQQLGDIVTADKTMQAGTAQGKRLCLLLELAAGWFYFGEQAKARRILDEARAVLLAKELSHVVQTELARAYLAALGQAPMDFALARIMEFFRKVEGVYDPYVTTSHYSLSRFTVVEAMMLALISDDFTLDPAARQRLDDDEYLVRRRIHRDVREALKCSERDE